MFSNIFLKGFTKPLFGLIKLDPMTAIIVPAIPSQIKSNIVSVKGFLPSPCNDVPKALLEEGAQLAGCIGGAEKINDFVDYFKKTGFSNVEIVEMKKVHLPDDIFEKHLEPEMVEKYKDVKSDEGIFSVTLVGEKPSACAPETCCCNPDKHQN